MKEIKSPGPSNAAWPLGPVGDFEEAAGFVIATYAKSARAERYAGNKIGERVIRGRIIPPLRSSENIFKRLTYRLAADIASAERVEELREYVITRDQKTYRPRFSSVVDWTLRLINRRPKSDSLARKLNLYANADRHILLGDSRMTRMATELNLALDYKIKWQLCDMFICHMGGYKLISAHNVIFDQDLSRADSEWLNCLSWGTPFG